MRRYEGAAWVVLTPEGGRHVHVRLKWVRKVEYGSRQPSGSEASIHHSPQPTAKVFYAPPGLEAEVLTFIGEDDVAHIRELFDAFEQRAA